MAASWKVLVAIASHGNAQDHFLRQVVSEYLPLGERCRIVVLSNVAKRVAGAEVRIGVPTADPYSLPFAHRAVFAENVEDFDLFIYSEDDTLISVENIEAFRSAQRQLEANEVAGFLRSEVRTDGGRQIVSANHHFRWRPESVVRRGTDLYAKFSNQHSGCYIVTRTQLQRAIDSGGFLVEPRRRRYGMLETAASDIYTQCGLVRRINLSRIHDFIVPHLANKYFERMGVPVEDLLEQLEALKAIHAGQKWAGTLVEPEARTPHFRWSKNLYECGDRRLLGAVPSSARHVLSIGASWGGNERALVERGLNVTAVPIDAVFGHRLERLGVTVVAGSLDEAAERLSGNSFDVILLDDILHRALRPTAWLSTLRPLLAEDGRVLGSIPVAPNALTILRDIRDGSMPVFPRFEVHGLHGASRRRLKRWLRAGGLESISIVAEPEVGEGMNRGSIVGYLKAQVGARLVFSAGSAS